MFVKKGLLRQMGPLNVYLSYMDSYVHYIVMLSQKRGEMTSAKLKFSTKTCSCYIVIALTKNLTLS